MFAAALLLSLSLAAAQQPQDPALPAQLHALRAGLAGLQDRLLALEQQVYRNTRHHNAPLPAPLLC